MDKKDLRKYVKKALEYGFYDGCNYNNELCGDGYISFRVFYAKNEMEFFQNLIKKLRYHEREWILDNMKENGDFTEEEIEEDLINEDDLIEKVEIAKKYIRTDYKYTGEGYYDFWEEDNDICLRIDEMDEWMNSFMDERGISYKNEITEEYIDERMEEIDEDIDLYYSF